MFEFLRKMILPIIIIVLVFFLGMIVLQWGADISGSSSPEYTNVAGEVNGEEISFDAFNSLYQQLYQQESNNYEQDLPRSKTQELEDRAFDQLVQDRLLRQQAKENNVFVTDDDVFLYLQMSPPQYLQSISQFQTDGQFDYQKYLSMMADPNAAPFWAQVEPAAREDMMKIKLQQLVLQAATLTDDDVLQKFLADNETVSIGMINLPLRMFSGTVEVPSDEEAEVYYNEHQEDYPADARVRLALAIVKNAANEDDWQAAKHQAMLLADSARDGADFADLATAWSADPGSARNGGELGWFNQGRMVAPFDSAVFAMKPGEVSDPVRSIFGWHVIKVDGFRDTLFELSPGTEKQNVHQARASHILLKPEASEATTATAYEDINEVATLAHELGIAEAATQVGISVDTTNLLQKNGFVQALMGGREVITWGLNNKVGTVSDIIEVDTLYVVAEIIEKMDPGISTFEEVKTMARRDLQRERALKICTDSARAVYARVEEVNDLQKIADEFGLKYETPRPLTRSIRLSEFSSDFKPIGVAFSLKEDGDIAGPVDYSQGSVIMERLNRTEPDLTEFEAQKDSIRTTLMTRKQQMVYQRWFQKLIEDAEIENYMDRPEIVTR